MKVISFSLWGDNPKYTIGALENAHLASTLFPGWLCYFYYDYSVPVDILTELQSKENVKLLYGGSKESRYFWRFFPVDDPEIEIVICRDTDSRLSLRDKLAVHHWLLSEKNFHIIRDHPWHNSTVNAGLWGSRYLDLEMVGEVYDFLKTATPIFGFDQQFLSERIMPKVRDTCFIHDEFKGYHSIVHKREDYEYLGEAFEADGTLVCSQARQVLIDALS